MRISIHTSAHARAHERSARSLVAVLALAGLAGPTAAQQLPAPPPRGNPADLPLDSQLWRAAQEWRTTAGPKDALRADLERRKFVFGPDGRIHLDIERPAGLDSPLAGLLAAHDGYVDNQVPGRADVWLPVDKLIEFARALPEGNFIFPQRPLLTDGVLGEGPAATNSDSYIAGGADGGGITIGVIDGNYTGLTAARANGDAPSSGYTLINYTPDPFESGSTHGTGCVEAVFDHAPGATYRIYHIDSVTDIGTAVNSMIAAGGDVMSMSLSYYNLGWADDTGAACSAANNAAANGMLFFTSAGNRAQSHHQGFFADSDGDGWCEFSGTTDETISVTVPGNPGDVNLNLAWNGAGGTDYDLYLWNAAGSAVIVSSTNAAGVFESISWVNPSAGSTVVNIAVYKRSGPGAEFEIFDHNGGTWNEHITASSSTTSPSNSTNRNVISVAAVDQVNFGAANGSNVVMGYSSRGPSNVGLVKPDITGPTNTTGFTYPSGFGGTSSATPNAAGAASAFWSSDLQLDATAVRWLLEEQADVYRDWGASGNETTYGEGGLQLVDHHTNSIWMDRSFGNTANLRQWPIYTLQAAENTVVWGGRVLVINGATYPEVATLDNNFMLEVIGGTKTFGN